MPPLLTCDDDDEARGLVTVLERAGILVELRDYGGLSAVDVAPQDEPRARALLGRLVRVHAGRLDRDRDARRRARERLFVRAAQIAAGVAALVWLVAAAG